MASIDISSIIGIASNPSARPVEPDVKSVLLSFRDSRKNAVARRQADCLDDELDIRDFELKEQRAGLPHGKIAGQCVTGRGDAARYQYYDAVIKKFGNRNSFFSGAM
jgi:hypothetical protein